MPTSPLIDNDGQPLFEVALQALNEGQSGNGVRGQTDLRVTDGTNANESDIAAGSALYNGTEASLGTSVTKLHSDGDQDFPRWDLLAFDVPNSTVVLREGTPTDPSVDLVTPPDLQSGEVLLALVYVESQQTDFGSDDIINWRVPAQDASMVYYSDGTGQYSVDNVSSALDELQEAAQIGSYPLANSDLANSTLDVIAGTALNTTNQSIGLGGSATLDVSGVTDSEIDSSTTIARSKLDQNKITTTVSSATTTSDEEVIFADTSGGAFTLTVASADVVDGNEIVTVDVGGAVESNPLTIDTESTETIDGQSSITLDTNYGAQVLQSDGSNLYTAGGGSGGGGGVTNDTIVSDDSGTVTAGNFGTIYLTEVPDGSTLEITQAFLTLVDGQPAPSGCDLILATLDGSGGGTSQVTLVAGDGATAFNDEEGSPLGAYTNSSGSAQTVALGVDNGNFNSGSGSSQDVAAGGIGEVK